MRTTLNLNGDLVLSAKRRALETGSTLSSVIEQALRKLLEEADLAPSQPYQVEPYGGSGTRPGFDLSNNERMLDSLE